MVDAKDAAKFPGSIAHKIPLELRRALIAHQARQAWAGSANSLLPRWSPLGRELKRLGLIKFTGPRDSTTELTPLGLEVRAILERNDHEQG